MQGTRGGVGGAAGVQGVCLCASVGGGVLASGLTAGRVACSTG